MGRLLPTTLLHHKYPQITNTKRIVHHGLLEIHALVSAWASYMNDLYFMCGQTNKNLGSIY